MKCVQHYVLDLQLRVICKVKVQIRMPGTLYATTNILSKRQIIFANDSNYTTFFFFETNFAGIFNDQAQSINVHVSITQSLCLINKCSVIFGSNMFTITGTVVEICAVLHFQVLKALAVSCWFPSQQTSSDHVMLSDSLKYYHIACIVKTKCPSTRGLLVIQCIYFYTAHITHCFMHRSLQSALRSDVSRYRHLSLPLSVQF